jgi:transketolase
MPCWELFEVQDAAYHESVLPAAVTARVAVEMASPFGWERWLGTHGVMLGMRSFGASAPAKDLLKRFGFEPEAVVAAAKKVLARSAPSGVAGRSGSR